jgi:hypothetical protein
LRSALQFSSSAFLCSDLYNIQSELQQNILDPDWLIQLPILELKVSADSLLFVDLEGTLVPDMADGIKIYQVDSERAPLFQTANHEEAQESKAMNSKTNQTYFAQDSMPMSEYTLLKLTLLLDSKTNSE